MKYSQLLIPTMKEVPAEAEIPSHQLMLRAGYIRKLASGTYTYLLLGQRSLRKIMEIIRQEMDAAGAQEISMPILQPIELWQQTGREADYGPTMCKFKDRHGRINALAPTAEEVVTSLIAGEVSSYKQLPQTLYQINTKFRDEFRPRFGALRSREFVMKDAYSFDATQAGLDESYLKMRAAYQRIFKRCGVNFVIVQAEAGEIGGSGSEEFMIPCSAGEDVILSSDRGGYAANVEKAEIGQRPYSFEGPATGELTEVHTPEQKSIEDVCKFMKVKPQNLLKTLVLKDDEKWIIAVVRGDHELNEHKLKKFTRGTLSMEIEADAIKEGFTMGYVGPHTIIGRENAIMVVDPDAAQEQFWAAGANKFDHHVKHFNWKRDVFDKLGENAAKKVIIGDIRNAVQGDPSPLNDGGAMMESHGIEVGHIFKLGTKYSQKLGATFLDENGQSLPCIMGCYGIGVNRILASAIEAMHDENGCMLPISISPFEVEVIPLNNDKEEVRTCADNIYGELSAAGIEVLYDDRQARPGVKFKDSDLIGIPLRVVIGERTLAEGKVEIKVRTAAESRTVGVNEAVAAILGIVEGLKNELV
ncbi:MAG TPA: proline--tRNA ligase [Phycisphaerae bacterium]|nr:proline--tRNA ligase [Phycisphaerae bacterium]